jgi:hypothetical protein
MTTSSEANGILLRLQRSGLVGQIKSEYLSVERMTTFLNEHNAINRRLRESRVRYWCSVIGAGNWVPASALFHVDVNGNLLNGQHRMTAGVRCGHGLWAWVLYGLSPQVANALDVGGTPRIGQDFVNVDTENKAATSSVITNLHRIECGHYSVSCPNVYRLRALEDKYGGDIEWGVKNIYLRRTRLRCPAHVVAPFVFCHSCKSIAAKVEELAEQLVESTGRETGCAALALERSIMYAKNNHRSSQDMAWTTLLKTLRAIQWHVNGRRNITTLQSGEDGIRWAYRTVGYVLPDASIPDREMILCGAKPDHR